MKKSIVIDQITLLNEIDRISIRLENEPDFSTQMKKILLKNNKKQRNTLIDKKPAIICAILKETYKSDVISETTVWRLIKIKEKNPLLYDKVLKGERSIKETYTEIFDKNNNKLKKEILTKKECKDINLNNLSETIKNITYNIDKWENNLLKEPDIYKLKEIDNDIFLLRKRLGKIIVKYDTDEI